MLMRLTVSPIRGLTGCVIAAVALLAASTVARSEPHHRSFVEITLTDFARDTVSASELYSLPPERVAILRGVVFGRHGRVFRDAAIQAWLEQQGWYVPDSSFSNTSLNAIERMNLDRIREHEALGHEQIEPGDLRWWQAREMTPAALGYHSQSEWSVLAAEVEAVHGKRFGSESWLQRYFDERYWYARDSTYESGRLSPVERGNLAMIDSLRRGAGSAGIWPCEMELYEHRRLTLEQLRGANFYTLRILRNEIYARHGLTFGNEQLRNHFSEAPWYVPRPEAPVVLSGIERANVATIVRAEAELHAALSTDSLDERIVEGLFREDLRRLRYEIHARHGRVFRERWIQDWVQTLAGYRPDPGYSDLRLTPIERANVARLAAYEPFTLGEHDAPEG